MLDSEIPDKGKVLTGLSLWWFDQLSEVIGNHVISSAVPEAVRGRGLIVENLAMLPVECVARGYLTGSGMADYKATGSVCGIRLPAGLDEADRLEPPIFTPATKAELGDHDENVSLAQIAETVGTETAEKLRELYLVALAREPAKDELAVLLGHIEQKNDDRAAYADVLWALLNTKEFLFNH